MTLLTEPEKKILDAAKLVFEAEGYAGARMQQIADAAQISKASLHYYFRSKEKLFDYIFEETMADFMPLISTWDNDDQNWEEKLRNFITHFFTFLKTNSLLFIIREVNRNPDLLLKRKKDGKYKKILFISYFDKLQKQGVIRNLDVKIIFIFLHSLCAYPLLNSVLFKMNMNLSDKEYDQMMKQYPAIVADFLIEGIKCSKKK